MTNDSFEEQEAPGPAPEDATGAVDVDALKAERDALQDRLRREQAESAGASLLVDVLPVVDNLERALQAPAGPESAGYRAGVELIHRQMVELLRKRGVTTIEALGTDFDPRIHQAVSQETSDAHRDGEVMEELQRGYMLGDRLLRAAMVKVARS